MGIAPKLACGTSCWQVVHEVKNLLSVALGRIDLAADPTAADCDRGRNLGIARESLFLMAEQLHQLQLMIQCRTDS
jgi:hypothetical protein